MSDRSVFDPAERRRVAEEMFRAELAPRLAEWVSEILADPRVRDVVAGELIRSFTRNGEASALARADVRLAISRAARLAVDGVVVTVDVQPSARRPEDAP